MAPAIIASLISSGVTILVFILTSVRTTTKQREEHNAFVQDLFVKLDKQSELADTRLEAKLDKVQAVTDAKIDELTREVREHNNFARRVPVLEEKISVANNRIADLEAVGTRMQTQIIDGYSHR